jgi:hypothetical protein
MENEFALFLLFVIQSHTEWDLSNWEGTQLREGFEEGRDYICLCWLGIWDL